MWLGGRSEDDNDEEDSAAASVEEEEAEGGVVGDDRVDAVDSRRAARKEVERIISVSSFFRFFSLLCVA
jgi:hypothetical protein